MIRLLQIPLVFFLSLTFVSAQQKEFPSKRFEGIYNLKFDTASILSNSQSPYELLADDYQDFLYLQLKGDPELFQKLSERESKRIEKIEASQSSEAIKQYCIAETELHWALLKLRFGDYLECGLRIRRAYKRLSLLQETNPELIEVNKSLGLLHILLSSIPEEYDWLINLFGLENNLEKGINELNLAAGKVNPFQNEARLLQAYVNYFVLNKEQSPGKMKKSLEPDKFKINSMVYLVICHKAGYTDDGLSEINKDQWIYDQSLLLPFVYLLRGELYLKQLDFDNSAFNLKNFLLIYNGQSFISNARLKLFYCYYLNEDEVKAKKYFENDGNSKSIIISDKYANEFFAESELPDKILLRARLLFDGGYYDKALKEIIQYENKSKYVEYHQIEYYYRIARIYQKLNDDKKSEASFLKCIETQGKGNDYFAPNACLQLGHFYLAKGNKEKAKVYFEKALNYKKYAYKRSIEHQAKSALNSIP